MNAIYATFITALFSAWVWDLKSQVAQLRGECMAGAGGASVPNHEPTIQRPQVHHTRHVSHKKAPVKKPRVEQTVEKRRYGPSRTNNGVPTWVIE